ncbi:J domain-containing protein [Arthrobacter sp. ATA002]|uniref:J domain-containing protein n=1 Tax=Arthrobacter sp. ATA002 TaxID=2991715 RepID=UPI0022A6A079|nr:J domain-containing protein [Arthrobacter sp. ATA002]WAP52720.1 J domain-containing protein [Arthrobacter sp. ATA002]
MSPSPKTLYEVLGLAPSATADQIKTAYRKAARATHPDHGGSAETFHVIAEAYEVLSNPGQKAAYDLSLRRGRGAAPGSTEQEARERGPVISAEQQSRRRMSWILPRGSCPTSLPAPRRCCR